MDIIVAGATGVLGRHITTALTAAGHTVLGLGRGPGNPLRADLLDREAVLRAVDGRHADAVVHAATALAKPPMRHKDMTGTDRLRTKGMANLVDAAHAVGATRLVTENFMLGYGYFDHGAEPLPETAPFAPVSRDPKFEEHLAAMRTKERLTFSATGLEGVSLRFGLFYGEGGTDSIVKMLRRRALPLPDDHGRILPMVDLADAGEAVRLAVEKGRAGAAYNIADDARVGFGTMVRRVAATYGLPKPLTLPIGVFRLMPYVHAMLTSSLALDTTKARTELGWRPSVSAEGKYAGR